MSHDEEDLTIQQLDLDSAGEQLMGAIRDEQECPAPELDWQSIEAKLFARIEPRGGLEDDEPLPLAQLDQDRPSHELQDVIRDSKECPPPEPDWQKVDARLFGRIEGEGTPRKNNVAWLAFAGGLAAAAAAALFLSGKTEVAPPPPVAVQAAAGSLLEHRGDGEIRVDGIAVADGRAIGAGNHIEALGTVGVFDRPEKVRWLIESGSAVSVEKSDGALVLALEKGAAEAQVVPVPNGEAFAIDVTSAAGNVVRVAVHGTHLRVARSGDHVTVDLTEGVVSIGAPPKRGSTLGELVTAPAHVELDIDSYATLNVEHAGSDIRSAVSLAPEAKLATASGAPAKPEAAKGASVAPPQSGSLASAKPAPSVIDSESANALVERCILAEPQSPNVTVTASTTLTIPVDADGYVRQTVRFNPALAGPTQKCVTDVLWDPSKTRFGTPGGHVVVNVEVTH